MGKVDLKFKVNLIESERGWGKKIVEVKEFGTYKKAVSYIEGVNKKNDKEQVPDWYMYAEPANFKINKTIQ